MHKVTQVVTELELKPGSNLPWKKILFHVTQTTVVLKGFRSLNKREEVKAAGPTVVCSGSRPYVSTTCTTQEQGKV